MTVVDLGAYGPDFTADPYPYYAKLRASGPVHQIRTPTGDLLWLIVGHHEARAALADPRLSKSPATVGRTMLDERVIGPNLLVADPPDHTRLRRSSPASSPRVESPGYGNASSTSPTG